MLIVHNIQPILRPIQEQMGYGSDTPAAGGAFVPPSGHKVLPMWLRKGLPEETPVLLIPSWPEVADIGRAAGIGAMPTTVKILHRIILRHELTHYLRWKKGCFGDHQENPRPWSFLVILREEVIANVASVSFLPPKAQRAFLLRALPIVLASTAFATGGWKNFLWTMTFGLLGEDIRPKIYAAADLLTEAPPPYPVGEKREVWDWQTIYPWRKPYVVVKEDTRSREEFDASYDLDD
jgi:hypothetical protein